MPVSIRYIIIPSKCCKGKFVYVCICTPKLLFYFERHSQSYSLQLPPLVVYNFVVDVNANVATLKVLWTCFKRKCIGQTIEGFIKNYRVTEKYIILQNGNYLDNDLSHEVLQHSKIKNKYKFDLSWQAQIYNFLWVIW